MISYPYAIFLNVAGSSPASQNDDSASSSQVLEKLFDIFDFFHHGPLCILYSLKSELLTH